MVYTGTHDTPTFVQFLNEARPEEASYARRYLRLREEEGLGWESSPAHGPLGSYLAIASLQDVLGLGADAMNTPAPWGPQLELAGPQRGPSIPYVSGKLRGDHPYLPPGLLLTPLFQQNPALCGHISRAEQVYFIYHYLIILFIMILPVYCSKYPPGPGPSPSSSSTVIRYQAVSLSSRIPQATENRRMGVDSGHHRVNFHGSGSASAIRRVCPSGTGASK